MPKKTNVQLQAEVKQLEDRTAALNRRLDDKDDQIAGLAVDLEEAQKEAAEATIRVHQLEGQVELLREMLGEH